MKNQNIEKNRHPKKIRIRKIARKKSALRIILQGINQHYEKNSR